MKRLLDWLISKFVTFVSLILIVNIPLSYMMIPYLDIPEVGIAIIYSFGFILKLEVMLLLLITILFLWMKLIRDEWITGSKAE